MRAVLVREAKGSMEEIELDIGLAKNEIFHILGGPGTFIGQWPRTDIVIMKCGSARRFTMSNENILRPPFHDEQVMGPILMIRMDKNADHQDFTLEECLERGLVSTPDC
jgi:hypothetical protein